MDMMLVFGRVFETLVFGRSKRWGKLPASMAFLAASLKSFTICGISSVLNLLGGVNCT